MAKAKQTAQQQPARQQARKEGKGAQPGTSATDDNGELYRKVFEDANDAIAVFAMDGTIITMNRGAERLLGWSRDALRGHHYRHVTTPTSVVWVEERRRRVLAGESFPQRPYELDLQRKDGGIVKVEARTQVIRDAAGNPLQFYGIFRDLSDRQQAEAMLREVADTIRDVIYVISLEGNLVYLNAAFATVTGWLPEEWIDKPFLGIVHPDDQARATEFFLRLLARETLDDFEMRIQAKNGAYLFGEFSATPQIRHGDVTGVLGIGRDIGKRKQVEEQLRESEALRARIVETMPDVLYVYDVLAQRLLYSNQQVFSVLGYHPDELCEFSLPRLQALVPEQDRERVVRLYQQFAHAREDTVMEAEFRVTHRNGEWRWLQSRTTALKRTAEGRPHELLGMAHDITERKRLEEQLQTQAIQPEDMPARLRKFRESLKFTQPEFGREFGGFNQRQMSGYETGAIDIPIELLLAIRAKGFPLDAILGSRPTAVLEKTALYFSTMYATKTLEQQLAATLAAVLARDVTAIERALRELNLPTREWESGERQLLERLAAIRKAQEEE